MSFERVMKSFDTLIQELPADQRGWSSDSRVREIWEAATLQKSFGTGSPQMPATFASGSNVTIQNLDGLFTSVLFDERHLVLWNWIPRVASINYHYEWTQRDTYGSARGFAGFPEGSNPAGSQSGWTRKNADVRWLGVQGGITHQASVTSRLGGFQMDSEQEENRNRTLELLNKLEVAAMWGDSTILDSTGKTVNFDGILKQMNDNFPERVVDLKGQPLTPNLLEDYAMKLATEGFLHGLSKVRMFMDGQVIADFSKLYYAAQRVAMGGERRADLVPGTPVRSFETAAGTVPFEQSYFMQPVAQGKPLLSARTPAEVADAGAPGLPTAPTMSAATNASSTFTTDDANTYYYVVGAVNAAGESLGKVSATGVAVAAGQRVTVVCTQVTGALMYRIYRGTKSDGTDAQFVGYVVDGGGGTTNFIDNNTTRPGTYMAVILNQSPEDIAMPMMSPLMRWPLAIVDTTMKFDYLLYATLVVKAPKRVVVFKNIGTLPS